MRVQNAYYNCHQSLQNVCTSKGFVFLHVLTDDRFTDDKNTNLLVQTLQLNLQYRSTMQNLAYQRHAIIYRKINVCNIEAISNIVQNNQNCVDHWTLQESLTTSSIQTKVFQVMFTICLCKNSTMLNFANQLCCCTQKNQQHQKPFSRIVQNNHQKSVDHWTLQDSLSMSYWNLGAQVSIICIGIAQC